MLIVAWQVLVILIVASVGVSILLIIGIIIAAVARRRYSRRVRCVRVIVYRIEFLLIYYD